MVNYYNLFTDRNLNSNLLPATNASINTTYNACINKVSLKRNILTQFDRKGQDILNMEFKAEANKKGKE